MHLMLKKIVAIVTLALGLGTSAIFGATAASAAAPEAPTLTIASIGEVAPAEDDGSSCRHSWKKCVETGESDSSNHRHSWK